MDGEPEARKIARQKRLAQKAAAMEAARQEVHARDNANEQEKSQKVCQEEAASLLVSLSISCQ